MKTNTYFAYFTMDKIYTNKMVQHPFKHKKEEKIPPQA